MEDFENLVYNDHILQNIRSGDKKTYRLIFKNYYKVLCLYATSLTKNDSIAEDIVQNVFLNLWDKRDSLHIRVSLKRYLFQMTYNLFINEYRRKRRESRLLDRLYYEVLQSAIAEEEQALDQRLDWVNKQIESLPPKSKKIFIMNKKRGLTYKEIALALEISENTVESHIGRALKRIRSGLPELLFLFSTMASIAYAA